jgi:hypothetical protein
MATHRQAKITIFALLLGLFLLLALVYRPSTTPSPAPTVGEQTPELSGSGLDPHAGRIGGTVFETIPESSLEAGLPQLMAPGQPMPHTGYYGGPTEQTDQ